MTGRWDFLKTTSSQETVSSDMQLEDLPVGVYRWNVPTAQHLPRYGLASRIRGTGGTSEWKVVERGTNCSVCERAFFGDVLRVEGHSWCDECNSIFERLEL